MFKTQQLRSSVFKLALACAVLFFAATGLIVTTLGGGAARSNHATSVLTSTSSPSYSGGHLMAADPHGGYWTVNWVGAVTAYDGALTYGSPALSGLTLSKPIVGMASTPDGKGYWLVGSDGGIFAYGDAVFYGSTGALHLNGPIVGMASTPDGLGYWLEGSDGGIFTFGDAGFYGSAGALHLNQPVVGMTSTPDGHGYWLVASDGGIFTYGDAGFYGSAGALHLSEPIVGMAPAAYGAGYWLVASDGGIFTYGDAGFYGSDAGSGKGVLGIIINPATAGYSLVQANGSATSFPLPAGATPPGSGGTSTTTTTTTTPGSTPTTVPTVAAPSTGLTPGTPGMDFGAGETTVFNSSPAQQQATFAAVKAAGAQWIRWNLPMETEEVTQGQFNWFTTPEIQAALAAGLKVDALLSTAPSWAATADGSPSPTAFAAFARAAVQEYAPLGISTYEIWNEENDTQAWGAAFTPADYTALLKASYAAIKAVDPSATVIVGGMAPAADAANSVSYEPVTFLTQMYADGAQGSFDAVALHPYSFPDLPDQTDSWNPFTYLPTLHQIMVANGDGSKQIWLTEYGAPTSGVATAVSPTVQAQSFTEAFQWAQGYSWVGPLFAFDWEPSSYDTYGDYGIFNTDGTPTPAGTAFSAAAAAYAG
jgi:hypothetical protein